MMGELSKRKKTLPHYQNLPFLKDLGAHCQRIRKQKGYSIDRVAKESENLSSSVIHRLETASGPVSVLSLFRYAQVLSLHPKVLLDFEVSMEPAEAVARPIFLDSDPKVKKEAFKTLLPLYSLSAAAGYFGRGEAVQRSGWIKVTGPHKLDEQMFVARAVGDSMSPKIKDGDYLVFRAHPSGTRQGKIVLVECRDMADPETGGAYTVKQYSSVKTSASGDSWKHRQITLSPLNPEFEPILLLPKNEGDFRLVAEYLFTLS